MTEPLVREIRITPGYERGSRGGWSAAYLGFYLRGPRGTVQFTPLTGWPVEASLYRLEGGRYEFSGPFSDGGMRTEVRLGPQAADLGYHSITPSYRDQYERAPGECPFVPPGQPCYYDGSSLNAEPYLRLLIEQGSDAVWNALEGYYQSVFGEGG